MREQILARLLLQYAVRREYGINSLEELGIAVAEGGKPFSQSHPRLHFNISHCCSACACMLSENACGIDVEKKFAFRPALAARVTTPGEKELFEDLSVGEKEYFLQTLWSMKESFVKCDGRGLRYGLEQVELAACLKEWMCRVQADKTSEQVENQRIGVGEKQEQCTAIVREWKGELLQKRGPGGGQFLIRDGSVYTLAAYGIGLPDTVREVQEETLANIIR